MTTLETHVADVCPSCKGNREIAANFATRRCRVSVAEACTRKAECEAEMKAAAGLGVTPGELEKASA